MPPRKHPLRIARELALLSLSQIKGDPGNLEKKSINDLIIAAVNTLTAEIQEALETAAGEISKSNERIEASDTRAANIKSAQTMVREAISLTHDAINRLGTVVDFPEIVQQSSQYEVREYTIELIGTVHRRKIEIERELDEAMVGWKLSRLPKIDRDVLRIAVAEMTYLDVPKKVAIDEAIELAKRYSDEEGYKFINGVLRRVSNRMEARENGTLTDNSNAGGVPVGT